MGTGCWIPEDRGEVESGHGRYGRQTIQLCQRVSCKYLIYCPLHRFLMDYVGQRNRIIIVYVSASL